MNRTTRILLLSVCLALAIAGSSPSRSSDLTVTVRTPSSDVRVTARPDGTSDVSSADGRFDGRLDDVGRPPLPYRLVRVLLPGGTTFGGVDVSVTGRETLSKTYRPRLADGPAGPGAAPAAELPALAPALGDVFPSATVRYLGTGTWHGHAIACFAVFPLQNQGETLTLASEIRLTIRTVATPASAQVPAIPVRTTGARRITGALAAAVVNPEAMTTYPPLAEAAPPPGGFNPTAAPSLEGSPVEHVIITTEALANAYQRLADWRTARGTPTVVRTLSWILQNYRRGSDDPETMRYFIRDAYEKWGTLSVLLGGDTGDLPPRYLISYYYYGGKLIPADIYFEGLDGSWNADHDDLFGEHGVDDPDLFGEVFVSRLPLSTVADVDIMIDKIIAYETAVDREYTDKTIFMAEVLFPAPWAPGDPIDVNGATTAEWVIGNNLGAADVRLTRMYETDYLYAGSVHESRATAIDSLNAGFNHVFDIGHGYRFNMHVGDANITIPDADALQNDKRFFNLYMLNCTANAFDFDCLGEHFLRNPHGGAVSSIGASNSAFPSASNYYMDEYAHLVFEQDVVHLGEAFSTSRVPRSAFALIADGPDYWTHLIYSALADPAMQMFTGPVDTLAVTYPDTIPVGPSSFDVTVFAAGVPQDSAVVCLWKGTEDYQTVATNPSGVASFTFTPQSPGSLSVVVTAHNRAAWSGTMRVATPPGAYMAFEDMTVDDDSLGGTYGNGDGVIDAGETVDLVPTATNTGTAGSAAAVMTLSTANPAVSVIDAAAALPPAGPGQTVAASDPWRITVSAAAADETVCDFDVAVTDGVNNWTDTVTRLLHAPELEFTTLRIDDTVLGNGDGTIQSLEPFQLFCSVKNFGSGTAWGLQALVSDGGLGTVSVTQGTDQFGPAGHLEEVENESGFVISETSSLVENPIAVTVTDAFGRAITDTIELRAPDPPSNLQFDASLGEDRIVVWWDPGAAADIDGYHVYRSSIPGGPFQRATIDAVGHTTFTDIGLASSTRYYYMVTSVDSSGNESAPSAEWSASTNAPQASGWPNTLVDASANSPILGDIDGDNDLEIIVGNNFLYAWHHDGQEVRDGDGEALTYGVFSDAGADFIGPAALAKIDADFGLDIVAASWSTNEVFVFNHDGSVLPGWPQATIDRVRASMVVGDLDGDEDPEIVAVDQNGYLYAWHHDGQEYRDGDSDPLTSGVFVRFPDSQWWQYQAPALADIDDDGRQEIIIGTQDANLYVLNDDGSAVPGWPRALNSYAGGGVAVGDIDGDGALDIVVSVKDTGETMALRSNNTLMWIRWFPQNLFFNPAPALADIDNDGTLETFLPSSNGKLYGISHTGGDLPGWPVTYSTTTFTESSPVIADVSGDGVVDVILGDDSRFIKGWSADGTPLDGFPLATIDAMRGTPAIADIDRDGTVEIVAAGYDRTVYVWNFSTPYNASLAPWPMKHANWHRNGTYDYAVPTAVTGVSFAFEIRRGAVRAQWDVPAALGPVFTIERATVTGGATSVFSAVADAVPSRGGSVEWIDTDVHMGETYVYRLVPGDGGEPFLSGEVRIPVTRAAVEQNYPNPFNPTTTIVFYVPEGAGAIPVRLTVYDVTGARVRTLVDSDLAPGRYAAAWDGTNDGGNRVGSGVYFYRVVQPGFSATRKMVLLK